MKVIKSKKKANNGPYEDTIKPLFQKLVVNLLKEKPQNVALYMLNWISKEGGYTSTGLTLDEKNELENLRSELSKYREFEEKRNKQKENEKDTSSKKIKSKRSSSINEEISSEEDDDDIDPDLDKVQPKTQVSSKPRQGVSAESYGQFNKKEDFKPRVIKKTPEEIQRIKTRMLQSFLFNNLEQKELGIVIDAMEEKKYNKDDYVIKQGDNGDCLFLIESGNLSCSKVFKKGEEPKLLKKYLPGDYFGELALLYNCPRAASIKCDSDLAVCWSLDRLTFNCIVKDAAQKKREKYEEILKKVEILSTIDNYELTMIVDALKITNFHKDDYIIREGELGDLFYILIEGTCIATKNLEPGKPDQVISQYKEGQYFGERALLKGEPRYANIIATSDIVKLASLDRNSFKRLFGPIEEILKRNMDKYQQFTSK